MSRIFGGPFTRFHQWLFLAGLSLYMLLLFLTLYGTIAVGTIPLISNIYQSIQGPSTLRMLGAGATSLVVGATIFTVVGMGISWFKKLWFTKSAEQEQEKAKQIYTPEFVEALSQQNRTVPEKTQLRHEKALENHPKSFKPFRHCSLFFSYFRFDPTLYHFNSKVLTFKAPNHYLGKGSFGTVKKHFSTLNEPLAVKTLKMTSVMELYCYQEEVEVLKALGRLKGQELVRHPGFYKGYILTDFYPGQTLQHLLDTGAFKPVQTLRIMQFLVKELHALHLLGYVHNDLKPLNVMVNTCSSTWEDVKLIDFGASCKVGKISFTVSHYYSDPIIFNNTRIPRDISTDIYSLGQIFHELIVNTNSLDETTSSRLNAFIQKMIFPQSTQRPTLEETEIEITANQLYISTLRQKHSYAS